MYGDHSLCSPTWCRFLQNPDTYKPSNLPYGKYLSSEKMKTDLNELMQKYILQADRLSNMGSTQANESFNNLVVLKNPKSHFYSGSESTCFRVGAATAQKNIGKDYILKVCFACLRWWSDGDGTNIY